MSDKTTKERLIMIETKLENISEDIKNYIRRTDERITKTEDCKADKNTVESIRDEVSKKADKSLVETIKEEVENIRQDIKYFTRWAIGILFTYVLGQIALNRDNIMKLFGG